MICVSQRYFLLIEVVVVVVAVVAVVARKVNYFRSNFIIKVNLLVTVVVDSFAK